MDIYFGVVLRLLRPESFCAVRIATHRYFQAPRTVSTSAINTDLSYMARVQEVLGQPNAKAGEPWRVEVARSGLFTGERGSATPSAVETCASVLPTSWFLRYRGRNCYFDHGECRVITPS